MLWCTSTAWIEVHELNEKTNYICLDGKYCVYVALHRRKDEFTFSSALIMPSNYLLVCFSNSTRSLNSVSTITLAVVYSIFYYFGLGAISYFYGVPCWLLEKICHKVLLGAFISTESQCFNVFTQFFKGTVDVRFYVNDPLVIHQTLIQSNREFFLTIMQTSLSKPTLIESVDKRF